MNKPPNPLPPKIIKEIEIKVTRQGTQMPTMLKLNVSAPHLKKELEAQGANVSPNHKFLVKISDEWADLVGKWSWGEKRDWTTNGCYKDHIEEFRRNYHQKKTWGDVKNEKSKGWKKHKSYYTSQIVKDAQTRLKELEKDDFEEIFRFRLMGSFRFYGLVLGDVFFSLWHDPSHKIYKGKHD